MTDALNTIVRLYKTTDEPDDVNGRFEALGWAKSFDTHGSVTFKTTFDPNSEIAVPEMTSSDR